MLWYINECYWRFIRFKIGICVVIKCTWINISFFSVYVLFSEYFNVKSCYIIDNDLTNFSTVSPRAVHVWGKVHCLKSTHTAQEVGIFPITGEKPWNLWNVKSLWFRWLTYGLSFVLIRIFLPLFRRVHIFYYCLIAGEILFCIPHANSLSSLKVIVGQTNKCSNLNQLTGVPQIGPPLYPPMVKCSIKKYISTCKKWMIFWNLNFLFTYMYVTMLN